MFRSLLTAALLASVSFASPTPVTLETRDIISADTIVQDVKNIDTGVNNLRAANAAYEGGLLEQTPLLAAFTEIHLANRKGFADAELRATDFNAEESKEIVDTVVNTVGVSIPAAVDETIAKKELYLSSGTGPALVALLKVLLNDHDTFSAAVTRHITADRAEGAEVVGKIHDSIVKGIEAFSTPA